MVTAIVSGVTLYEQGDMVVRANAERKPEGFEPRSLAEWRKLASFGGTFVDVGAYTGIYAIAAKLAGADRVVAIEPNSFAAARLNRNAAENGVTVDLYMQAAWHECGRLMLYGRAPLSSAVNVMANGGQREMVDAISIDSLRLENVRGMKIDVERAERAVISGAMRTIKRDFPTMLVEELPDTDTALIVGMLEPLGYLRRPLGQNMVEWARP